MSEHEHDLSKDCWCKPEVINFGEEEEPMSEAIHLVKVGDQKREVVRRYLQHHTNPHTFEFLYAVPQETDLEAFFGSLAMDLEAARQDYPDTKGAWCCGSIAPGRLLAYEYGDATEEMVERGRRNNRVFNACGIQEEGGTYFAIHPTGGKKRLVFFRIVDWENEK